MKPVIRAWVICPNVVNLHPLSGITVLQKFFALTRESYLHEKVTETRNKNKKVE
jgi:hypothetical protein